MTLPVLRRGAAELGLELSERQFEQFEEYYRQLVDWNARFNLTSVTDYDAVQAVHFLDSLTVTLAVADLEDKNIIDVGAGAGFPGLPLKVAFPCLKVTLLEATGKKAVFLTHVAAALGFSDVTVLNSRAEEATRQIEHRENFDVVVSRAVASLDTLCELCLPFCHVGGVFIAMKKGDISAELDSAMKTIETLGGSLRSIEEVELSALPDVRKLVIIEKIAPTPPEYPRRSGVPAKKPLHLLFAPHSPG
jgi:16S rRNA (guanine527-N7)-methyltransferase